MKSDSSMSVGAARGPERRAKSSRGPKLRERPATAGLLLVCTLAFVLCWVLIGIRAERPLWALVQSAWLIEDVELLERAGGLVATRVWVDRQWWRVASAGLLHGSWLHLVLNMMGLWVVGQWTEKAWGGWRQLLLFWVASLGGCLASLAWAEASLVVGASAGIFGVAGALVVVRAWGRPELQKLVEPVSARTLGFWLGFWLVIGAVLPRVLGVSLLAQAGHAGGLVFGCLLGWGMSRPKPKRGARIASGLLVGAGLLGVGLVAAKPSWRPNYDLFMGDRAREDGRFDEAVAHYDRALERAPEDDVLTNAVAYSLAEAGVSLGRAERLVQSALEVDPDSPHYLDTLGWIYCKQGRTAEALELLERADSLAEGEIQDIRVHIEDCAGVGVPRGTPGGSSGPSD